jgi:hypothetical protein
MKQETFEETALRLYPNRESFLDRFQDIEREAFIKGYKLAQERSYSEEEFAIDFAEWCDENYFRIGTTSFWAESLFDEKAITYKTEELLEIYKKTL